MTVTLVLVVTADQRFLRRRDPPMYISIYLILTGVHNKEESSLLQILDTNIKEIN